MKTENGKHKTSFVALLAYQKIQLNFLTIGFCLGFVRNSSLSSDYIGKVQVNFSVWYAQIVFFEYC